MKKYFSSLRHRDFRLFFSGQMVSLTGSWMQNIAQGWLVLQITNSPFIMGIVNAVASLPILLFSLVGGVISDRLNKRNLVILTQTVQMLLAFAMGVLISTKLIALWQIIIIAGVVGLSNALDSPARQSFIIEMVGKDDLSNAIALNSLIFNIARILGPIIAGFMVGTLGVAACFYFNGISFLAVIAGLWMMRGNFSSKNQHHDSLKESTLAGARYVWRNKEIRNLIILIAVSSLFGMSYIVLMPVFARDVLQVGPKGLGILVAAIGCGALLSALSLTFVSHSPKSSRFVSLGGMVLGGSLLIFGFSRSVPLSLLALVGVGWGLITQTATINNLLQKDTPDELRGRVMGFYTLMFLGMVPVGSFLAGLLAEWFGVPTAVGLGGGVCLLASTIFSRGLRD
ncbi:MAG: MFS transporter [bacterium]|nr:MFS transporter [bacterium]